MKRASAARITAVMPYFGYARQDRKAKARDPISAKLCADLITTAGADRVLTMDLHAPQIQGFFNIPVDHLLGAPILSSFLKERVGDETDDYVTVSPDLGSVTRARNFAARIGCSLAIVDKRRQKANVCEVMSLIEEAPHDRHPVQTYVLEHDNGLIAEAIRRELRRGGQVYYLHNDVASIERTAARLQAQIPEARIGFGHGKMNEQELSEVWRRLIEHEIDVLVCTTIIETGVDVPNANTLIIENADRMGLSQLHQIRGRVGRSSRRAYAYLTFTPNKVLTEIAQKRLSAIREFTEFGSGFKIAMEFIFTVSRFTVSGKTSSSL